LKGGFGRLNLYFKIGLNMILIPATTVLLGATTALLGFSPCNFFCLVSVPENSKYIAFSPCHHSQPNKIMPHGPIS